MRMIKKIPKERYISLQKREEKLLMIWDQNNSIIIEDQEIRNLIDNKTSDVVAQSYDHIIAKTSKNSQQDNSETVTNTNDKEMSKEIYISPEERQKIIDNLNVNIIV